MEECDLNKTKEITEAGLFAALLVVIITGVFYIPLLGGIMMLFVPVPIVILTMRVKPLYATASTVVGDITFQCTCDFTQCGLYRGFCLHRPSCRNWDQTKNDGLSIFFIGTVGAAVGFFHNA